MRKKRFFAVAVGRGPSKTFYVPCLTLLPPKSYSSLTQVLKIGEQTRTNYGFGTAKTTLRYIATTDYEHVTAVIGQSGHKWTLLDKRIGGTEKRHSFASETQKADAHSRLPFVWRN